VLYLALGALIWGALMGLVDGWKSHLPIFCSAAITMLVATSCAMSIERDFDHSVAGFIQIFLLLIVVSALIALARRRTPELAPQGERNFDRPFDPTFDSTLESY
jgi:Na+/H+ antiporter NhaC